MNSTLPQSTPAPVVAGSAPASKAARGSRGPNPNPNAKHNTMDRRASPKPIPAHLKPLVSVSSAACSTDPFDETVKKMANVRAMIGNVSQERPGAVVNLPFVQRRGEAMGMKRMSEAECKAYEAWKSGRLVLPTLANCTASGVQYHERKADSNPRWMNRAKDLMHLYGSADVSGSDAKQWELHAGTTQEMKDLAMAVRRVRNSTGKVAGRVAERRAAKADNGDKSAKASARGARVELRVLRGVSKDIHEARGVLRAKMADAMEEVSGAEGEVEKRMGELRAVLV